MNNIERIKELVEILNHYRNEYYNNQRSEVSDFEYDQLFDELFELEKETGFIMATSPTQTVGYEVKSELTKVKHNHPMLSLDKTKDWSEFVRYFGNKDVVGMIKLDGLTCSLRYVDGELISAETRGNGEEGEDILHNALVVKNIPKKINYTDELIVDGEIICTKEDFEAFKEQYANSRNFASGSIRLLDSQECACRNLKFVLWNVIKGPHNTVIDNFEAMYNLGFTVTPWTSSFDWDAKEFLVEQAEVYGYPIDGLVGRFNDIAFGESLGTTGHHSRAAYAFKFYDELYETKLLDIEWTMGKTNTLTPTAIFETVNIDGTDVSKASLHNISIIKKLGLTNNCTVRVYKANQIIPQIDSCLQDGDFDIKIPKYCPVCGGETEVAKENESEVLVCTNPNCSGKLLGRLKFFVSKPAMNIDGLSEATLEFLIDKGWVKSFKDIYYLVDYKNLLEKCSGFGKKSVEKMLDAIENSRNVKLENFICALSIDGVGKSASKTISNTFDGDFNAFYEAFKNHYNWAELEDVGDKTASNINNYLTKNESEIVDLASEMKFVIQKKTEAKENPFNGKTLCVTGKLNHFTRDSINEKIAELGAKSAGSVSKNTDYLITNEASGSSKYKKAVELNIPIITEDEFLNMIGE